MKKNKLRNERYCKQNVNKKTNRRKSHKNKPSVREDKKYKN